MDNLPIPQSRIENLMNAFISRDSSRISAPQSRVEEFWYHLIEGTNSLPIPQSRIELLLKKIIENDTEQIPLAQSRAEEFLVSILTGDINKLPIPQSRSEYYLDYIARNNLVLDDIEYLKYNGTNITATNTVQKPFKSAILKGNTEVIVVGKNLFNGNLENGAYSQFTGVKEEAADSLRSVDFIKVEPSSTICCSNNGIARATHIFEYDENKKFLKFNNAITKLILSSSTKYITFYGGNSDRDKMQIEYGEEPTYYEEYKQTLTSVKMPVLTTTGKNLFDIKKAENGYLKRDDPFVVMPPDRNNKTSDYIKVEPNTTYTYSFDGFDISEIGNQYWTGWYYYISPTEVSKNDSRRYVVEGENDTFKTVTFTTPSDCHYIRIGSRGLMLDGAVVQLEEGSTATSYEPYKSNILMVNEDVTLRGIDEVQDTLDCLTGEVTERIGEIVLDGNANENWTLNTKYDMNDTYAKFILKNVPNDMLLKNSLSHWITNRFKNHLRVDGVPNEEGISSEGNMNAPLMITIKRDKLTESTPEGFKKWLVQNPVTVQYNLVEPVIKTVDLKVVDQDGNPVNQLSAFDSTTHIISDSESDNSLIAIAEVEVPTKLIEALNAVKSLSSDVEMLINEVDNAQKLQDENSTMVMSAMTELYEMVLLMGGGS